MNTNEDSFEITDKGTAFVTYIGAQEQAADSGMAEDFGEALDTFERNIYIPIKRHVVAEMVLELVDGALENLAEDPSAPTFEELNDTAHAIGVATLETYAVVLEQQEGQDA